MGIESREDYVVWIDGVPYNVDDCRNPKRITISPSFKPTLGYRLKLFLWKIQTLFWSRRRKIYD